MNLLCQNADLENEEVEWRFDEGEKKPVTSGVNGACKILILTRILPSFFRLKKKVHSE